MNFDWSVIWRNAGALAEGTELTILLAVVTMAIAIPGGILLALMRLSGVRVFVGGERRLRRAVPQPAADPGDLYGVLYHAGHDRTELLADRHGDRRAQPQRLGL